MLLFRLRALARILTSQRGRERRRRWTASLGVILLAMTAATGCQPVAHEGKSGTLHVLIGTPSNEPLTAETIETSVGEFSTLIDGFRELHPEMNLSFSVLQESRLNEDLERRTAAGLAPDLILVSASRAVQLEQQGLIREVSIPPEQLKQLPMQGLTRVAIRGHRYAGIPVLQEPQVACFNRSRLSRAPGTVEELVTLAQTTTASFGFSVDPIELFWSTGSLGAREALLRALADQPLSAEETTRITLWLRWLQALNLELRISFLADKDQLVKRLAQRELDWIPCRSGNISLLRRHLGAKLGVAALPGGPGGPASPITRQLVWSFGRNSTPRQHRMAENLVRFSISPLAQRTLTLTGLRVLPANRLALPRPGVSMTMDALLQSDANGTKGHLFARLMAEDVDFLRDVRRILVAVIFEDLTPEQGTARLLDLRPDQP